VSWPAGAVCVRCSSRAGPPREGSGVRLLAALAVGVAAAAAVGTARGVAPMGFRGRPRERRAPGPAVTASGVSPLRFLAVSGAVGIVTVVVLTALTGSVAVSVVPAVAVSLAPRSYFARERRRRLRAVQEAWPDALRDLTAAVAAGRSLTQAVGGLATSGPEPLRTAFARFPASARLLGTVPALEIVRAELADPTSDRVIEVLELAHERGGAILRSVLEDLIEATARDVKLLDAIETESLEMRINARAVVVLPWLVLVALTARPGPFRAFYTSSAGLATVTVAGLLTVIGVVVLGRLGREPAEARVLGDGSPV